MLIAGAIIMGYLLGSIPFGLLAGWICGKDVRAEGSGNIGATNVVRVCGWRSGLPVFACDVGKGVGAVLLAQFLVSQDTGLVHVVSGFAAILGHNFPIWLRFKGGKGVATSAGVVGALLPLELMVALGAFLLFVCLFRYVSLGSMMAAVALVVSRIMMTEEPFASSSLALTVMTVVLCVLVILRHRANIGRLLAGTENKIGSSSKRNESNVSDEEEDHDA